MYAAVVKLDALPDAIGTTAQNHDLPAIGGHGLALVLIGRIHVGRTGFEFSRARIDALVDRMHTQCVATTANFGFLYAENARQSLVRKALLLEKEHFFLGDVFQLDLCHALFNINEFLDLHKEPHVDVGHLMHFIERHADAESVCHIEDALGTGFTDFVNDFFTIVRNRRKAVLAGFQTAQGFLDGFLEGRADGHHFAHGLHLRRQSIVGLREFLEGKTWHLGDHVVNGGLKRRGGCAARDVVFELVKRIAHGKLGGDLGNREPRCLRG